MPDQSGNTQQQHQERRRGHRPGGRGRGRGRPREHASGPTSAPSNSQGSPETQSTLEAPHSRPQRRPPRSAEQPGPADEPGPSHPPRPSRRERFRATLTEVPQTETQPGPPLPEKRKSKPPRRPREPVGDDLTSTLTHALRTPPFADCSICFSSIRPEQATWSCSPPLGLDDKDVDGSQCCWNTFHLKCIRAWAEKSVKELEEAWRARGESRPGEWRCPGCRATRQAVPHTYMCAHLLFFLFVH